MITSGFLELIGIILSGLLSIFSGTDWTLPAGLTSSVSSLNATLATANEFLPVGTVLLAFSALLVVETAIGIYKITMWGLKRLPTQS